MKFLKFRYIFTLAIVLVIGITLMVYFLGGLNATALDSTNLEFTYDGYKDYSGYDSDGNRWEVYDTKEEMLAAVEGLDTSEYVITSDDDPYIVQYMLRSERIVAQNDRYTMFLDEKSTIITVIENPAIEPTEFTVEGFKKYKLTDDVVKYATANIKENNDEARSNLILRYVGSGGRLSSLPFNTYTNSVNYLDLISGQRQRHYKIKFDVENGIEILYEIGEFTVIKSFFPVKFDRVDLMDTFVGNLVFVINAGSILPDKELRYTSAYTWSKECAAYLEERELATVTPEYSANPSLDEEGNPIPRRYNLSNILELNDDDTTRNVLKMKIGVDYNASDINAEDASPCIANPFANSYVYNQMISAYYALQGKGEDAEGNEISYSTDWRYNVENLSPTFALAAQGTSQFSKLYDYMYKPNTINSPNYLYEETYSIKITDKNYEEMIKRYPTANIGDTIVTKVPISYFEDINLVKKGYFNLSDGQFYTSAAFHPDNRIVGDETMDYMDLATFKTYVYRDGEYEETDRKVPLGGYQARDEDGNFLYDEDGKPVQEVYDVERANLQNDKYNEVVEISPPVFHIAMRFELTDNGLKTTLLDNSIREGLGKSYREDGKNTMFSHDAKIYNIDILPNFTANPSDTSEGQIIVPDGSGAIISFNSPKAGLGYTAFAKRIYGADRAFTFEDSQETQANKRMMFGMYGFLDKTEKKGVLAIADKGASQSSIYANFKRGTAASKNVAYFTALLRENETVYVGSARTPFVKWANEKSKTDFSYIYEFMGPTEFIDNEGNIQYVTLANRYRDYLSTKYGLGYKDNTSNNVLALNFLGSFEKREVSFGFAHNVDYSLTTFEQAENIIKELQAEGGESFAVSYTAWTRDSMEPRATNNVKVSKVLGDAKGIKSLQQFLNENDIKLYPEVRVTSNKGYDYSFGNMKYTSKAVGGSYSIHREYDLATRRASDTIAPITMLSPIYYVSYLNDLMGSYKKLGLNNAYFSDLGNLKAGDYSRNRTTYPETGLHYQMDALQKASDNLNSIMLSAPFDYALGYVDFAIDVPFESSLLGYYDYSIPFYQLVVSGLFDYTGPAVNYDSEKSPNWYLLKSLETGSNLQFILSAEDTKILLNTDYTMFYNTYYANWKNEIIRMNSIINEVGIHNETLVGHKILRDNVYEVEYTNGLKLIINFTNSNYYDYKTGFSVRPNWFVVVEEAN